MRLCRLQGTGRAIVKAGSTEGKACPAGGSDTGTKIAAMMGETATASDPKRTIIRCQGSHENARVNSPMTHYILCVCTYVGSRRKCMRYGCLDLATV